MLHDNKRILGIDPGLQITGISVIETSDSIAYRTLYCGCIETLKGRNIEQRLAQIYSFTNDIILKYNPYCLAVEEIFFSSNAKTAINVGQARGVILLSACINNIKVFEYTPLEVKQAISGYGRASKDQIKYMVKVLLKIKETDVPKKDDAWDSLAIAICHANSSKFNENIRRNI
ncbi:MAG: crossover junction endodeoxyribonuclease RuvC [Actinobacteria bacterium]|nr:crossover junction endodeoxyribonuclease RuvC [Actinomycetota bacterium]MCL6088483.1 crossover junction endodeoxyribonuclease RuvC [Actinomycetota bacterium]